MKLDIKLNEYKNNIESLKAIESLEVYRWLISLGEKLNDRFEGMAHGLKKQSQDRTPPALGFT